MALLRIEEVKLEIYRLAEIIKAEKGYLPTFDFPLGDATPFIEIKDGQYHYIISERGHEYERMSTTDVDELYYYVFRDLTSTMAIIFESMHRNEKQDCRRLWFQKQESLMEQLNSEWKKRIQSEINEKLRAYPFIDQ